MKKIILCLGILSSLSARAATLDPGETTNINGTNVTCKGGASNCHVEPLPNVCAPGAVKIFIGSNAVTECQWIKDAAVTLKTMRDSGICN